MPASHASIHTANSFDWDNASLFDTDQDEMDKGNQEPSTNRRKKTFSFLDGLLKSPKSHQEKRKVAGFDYNSMPPNKNAQLARSEEDNQGRLPSDDLQLPLAAMSLDQHASSQRDASSSSPPHASQVFSRRESFVRPFKNLGRMASASLLGKRAHSADWDEDLRAPSDRPRKTKRAAAASAKYPSGQAVELLRQLEPVPPPPAMRDRSIAAAHSTLSKSGYHQRSRHGQQRLPSIGHISENLTARRRGMVFQDDASDVYFVPPTAQNFSPQLGNTRHLPYPQRPPADIRPVHRASVNTAISWPTVFTSLRDVRDRYRMQPVPLHVQRHAEIHPATSTYGAYPEMSQDGHPPLVHYARNSYDIDAQHGSAGREVVAYPPMWFAEEDRHRKHRPSDQVRYEKLPQHQGVGNEWRHVSGTGSGNFAPPQPDHAQEAYTLPPLQDHESLFRQDSIGGFTSDPTTDDAAVPDSHSQDRNRSRRGSRAQRQQLLPPIAEEPDPHRSAPSPTLSGYQGEAFGHPPRRPTPRAEFAARTLTSLSSIDHLHSAPRYSGHSSHSAASGNSSFDQGPASWSNDSQHPALRPTFEADAEMRSRIQLPRFEIAQTRPMTLLMEPVDIDWSALEQSGNYHLSSDVDAEAAGAQSGVGYGGTPRVFRL